MEKYVINHPTREKEEMKPLHEAIRSDAWRSYKNVSKDLGIAHHRAVLRNPKNAPKL